MSPSSPMPPSGNPWTDAPDYSGLVPIGTHSLHLSVFGPTRSSQGSALISNGGNGQLDPLVIIFTGAGDVSLSWLPVRRLLSSKRTSLTGDSPAPSGSTTSARNDKTSPQPSPALRTLICDRSGLGSSERGPNRAIATVAAAELRSALQATALPAPYILVAHSYGAIVAREFLHLLPRNSVLGMILAEPATERQHLFFRIPDPDILAVMGNLNWSRVTGLRDDARLSRDEWRARAKLIGQSEATALEEAGGLAEVCETLGSKRQIENRLMGKKPVSVIRGDGKKDYEKIYEAGCEAGNGTAEERGRFRELLDHWEDIDKGLKSELLGLSGNSRFVEVEGCGHNIQLTRPEAVVKEIEWVVEQIKMLKERGGEEEWALHCG